MGSPAVSPSRSELAWAAFLAACCTLVLAGIVPPLFEVPQTDDWAYRLSVLELLEKGRFVDLGWGDPTLVLHILWGGLFASVFGAEYGVLRVATLSLVPLAVVSAYDIFRHTGLRMLAAAALAALTVYQPISLELAYSFNTDFPYFAVSTLGIALAVRAYSAPTWNRWFLTGTVLGLSFLIRQTGALLVPAAVLAIWAPNAGALSPGNRWSRTPRHERVGSTLALLAPVLAAVAIAALVVPRSLEASALTNGPFAVPAAASAVLARAIRELLASGLTLALLCLPVLLAGTRWGREPRWRGAVALLIAGAVGGAILLLGPWLAEGQARLVRGWPYQGNYLARQGLIASDIRGRVGSPEIWQFFTLVLPFLAGWFAVRASWLPKGIFGTLRGRVSLDRDMSIAGIIVLMGALQFVPFLFAQSFYDRYLVNALLPALVLVGHPLRRTINAKRSLVLATSVAILLTLSVEWTRYQVDRGQAIWTVANQIVESGVPPEEVHAGFEWRGHHLYLRAIEELGATPPFDMEAGFPWEPLTPPYRYAVTVIPGPESHPSDLIASYRSFLGTTPTYVGARSNSRLRR